MPVSVPPPRSSLPPSRRPRPAARRGRAGSRRVGRSEFTLRCLFVAFPVRGVCVCEGVPVSAVRASGRCRGEPSRFISRCSGSPPPVGPAGRGQPVGSKLPVTLKRPSPPVPGPGGFGGCSASGRRPRRQKTPKVEAGGAGEPAAGGGTRFDGGTGAAGAGGGTGQPREPRRGRCCVRLRCLAGAGGVSPELCSPPRQEIAVVITGLLEPVCAGGSGSPLPRSPGPPLATASTKSSKIHPKGSRWVPAWATGARGSCQVPRPGWVREPGAGDSLPSLPQAFSIPGGEG